MCGVPTISSPPRGEEGETKFGFTIGQWVEIAGNDDLWFNGWKGTVRAFDDILVAVDLHLPKPNGQWFHPKNLKAIPKPPSGPIRSLCRC